MNERFPCPRCGLGTLSWGNRCPFCGAFPIPTGPETPRSLVRELGGVLILLGAAALLLAWVIAGGGGTETLRPRLIAGAFAVYGSIIGACGVALFRTEALRYATAGAAAALVSFVAAVVLVFATRPPEVGAVLSIFLTWGALRVFRNVKVLRRMKE